MTPTTSETSRVITFHAVAERRIKAARGGVVKLVFATYIFEAKAFLQKVPHSRITSLASQCVSAERVNSTWSVIHDFSVRVIGTGHELLQSDPTSCGTYRTRLASHGVLNSVKTIRTGVESVRFGRHVVASSGVELVGSGGTCFALNVCRAAAGGAVAVA